MHLFILWYNAYIICLSKSLQEAAQCLSEECPKWTSGSYVNEGHEHLLSRFCIRGGTKTSGRRMDNLICLCRETSLTGACFSPCGSKKVCSHPGLFAQQGISFFIPWFSLYPWGLLSPSSRLLRHFPQESAAFPWKALLQCFFSTFTNKGTNMLTWILYGSRVNHCPFPLLLLVHEDWTGGQMWVREIRKATLRR